MKSGFTKVEDFYRLGNNIKMINPNIGDDWHRREGIWHRKTWECIYTIESLADVGCLRPGKKGLGFGVGTEILPSLFASMDVKVLATDQPKEMASKGWVNTGQFMESRESIYHPRLCPSREKFENNVQTRNIDMRSIPDDIKDFDFIWSMGSLEHLGSLQNSNDFIIKSLKTLKPGGIAVHTTEYAIFPYSPVERGETILYNRNSLIDLKNQLFSLGYCIDIDWDLGSNGMDYWVDMPPHNSTFHLKLYAHGHVCTSLALVITCR